MKDGNNEDSGSLDLSNITQRNEGKLIIIIVVESQM